MWVGGVVVGGKYEGKHRNKHNIKLSFYVKLLLPAEGVK